MDVKGWWQPTDADVPLKGWLMKHKGASYVERIGQKQWGTGKVGGCDLIPVPDFREEA